MLLLPDMERNETVHQMEAGRVQRDSDFVCSQFHIGVFKYIYVLTSTRLYCNAKYENMRV